ncbi:MAG TPA: hypothetical protein PK042_05645, partial [Usitatibacteraceae bacterium]|nr:hypothetical protein [Usitatibacteraceae bacterium]
PFYRWIAYLVSAVYPTFTFGDDPGKWVGDEAGGKRLREIAAAPPCAGGRDFSPRLPRPSAIP